MPYTINGTPQNFAGPSLMGGTTFVPLANVADAIGGMVEWDNLTKVASVELGDKKARVQADSTTAEINGNTTGLQDAPYIDSGTLWVPVRFFEQVLGCKLSVAGDNVTLDRQF